MIFAIDVNFWIGIGGLAVGVISIGVAVTIYRASLRERSPRYHVSGAPWSVIDASATINDLQVTFRGTPITGRSLWIMKVYFWNAGREPITAGDVLQRLEIALLPATVSILRATVLAVTRPFLKVSVSQDSTADRCQIDFDLLDQGDGFVVVLLFATPPELGRRDIVATMEGAIVGVKSVRRADLSRPNKIHRKRRRQAIVAAMLAIPSAALAVASIHVVDLIENRGHPYLSALLGVLFFVSGIVAFLSSIIAIEYIRDTRKIEIIPAGLDDTF